MKVLASTGLYPTTLFPDKPFYHDEQIWPPIVFCNAMDSVPELLCHSLTHNNSLSEPHLSKKRGTPEGDPISVL